MAAPELARKLGYRGGPAVVVGAPEGYDLGIEGTRDPAAPLAFAQVFIANAAELRSKVPPVLEQTVGDPIVWVAYPKRSSGVRTDVNRDIIARIVGDETAFAVVSNVAIDATWSALRLRPKALIHSKG